MSFSIVNYAGTDFAVLLTVPNVRKDGSLKVTYAFDTEIDTGDSGRETREPNNPDVRLQQTAVYLVPTAAEADALRIRLKALGKGMIAVPLWIDRLKGSAWADRVHKTAIVVKIATGEIFSSAGELDADAEYAPLLVGTYKEGLPDLMPWTDTGAGCETTITIVDDSPWDYRIEINLTVAPGVWPASLVPNWTDNIERADNGLKYSNIGVGRERAVENQEKAFKWGQEAKFLLKTRDEIRLLLATFVANAGRYGNIAMPWWFRPGPDTPDTPYNTQVRWASDSLVIDYNAGNVGSTTLGFWQVPWEIDPPEGEEAKQPPRAFLYRHTLMVPVSPFVWRFTDYARPISLIEDGVLVTYLPIKIQHDKISQDYLLNDDAVKLSSFVAENHPWLLILQRLAEAPIALKIFECNPDDAQATVKGRYTGEIGKPTGKGRKLSAPTTVLGGLLDIQVPNFYAQVPCNWEFCSNPGCTLSIEDYTCLGTVESIDGNTIMLEITSNPSGHDLEDDYFADGDLEIGASLTWQGRDIVRSEKISATVQIITLDRTLRDLALGAVITLRPTCSKSWEQCLFFGNTLNYGGHRFIGESNLSVPQRESDQASGKK